MVEKQATAKQFKPSAALIVFSVACIVVIVYVMIIITPQAPLALLLPILTLVLYALWWFISLATHSARFKVIVDERGIHMTYPIGLIMDYQTVYIEWKEIKRINVLHSKEFNPKYFLGRDIALQFTLQNDSRVVVHQITTLEAYTDLFAFIQGNIPFAYELPKDHLLSENTKRAILLSIAALFFILMIIFAITYGR